MLLFVDVFLRGFQKIILRLPPGNLDAAESTLILKPFFFAFSMV